jgi:hypothetical protein
MKNLPLFCTLLVSLSCLEKDRISKLTGFWVSADYKSGKPFQTLTISVADSTLYDAIPLKVETNQYGAYSYVEPLDTIHGRFEAYGPHWDVSFILNLEGDTLEQTFSSRVDDRIVQYVRVDSLKVWREAIFSDLLLQIHLPYCSESDNLIPSRKYFVADLFLGPLKESIRDEYPAIARDSMSLQVNDVLIGSVDLKRFLHAEQSKRDNEDRDSIIVVLNADDKIPDQYINEWVKRIKRFNPNLRVWQRCLNLDRRKFRYRRISNDV